MTGNLVWYPSLGFQETQNVMSRVRATVRGKEVDEDTVKRLLAGMAPGGNAFAGADNGQSGLLPVLAERQAAAILKALEKSGGRKGRAAARLGMSRSTLWRKIRELGIQNRQDTLAAKMQRS